MSNIACKGKIVALLKDLGFSKKMISEILKVYDKKSKQMTEKEAEEYFCKSNYS